MAKRIVFATTGSLGDLHPCLALGAELQRRGHIVLIAASEHYRHTIEQCGLGFRPMRPHWDMKDPTLVRRCENLKTGFEVLYRELLLPALRGAYDDLRSAASGADLLLAGELVLAAPPAAEKLGLRWGSLILSPCSFFSSYDPSVLVNVPWLFALGMLGRPAYRAGLGACRFETRHWWKPVRQLRRAEQLRLGADPLFQDKFSPHLVLALFSRSLAAPQPDWPHSVVQPGFVYSDQLPTVMESPQIGDFLAAGEPPLVFTLGSTAVLNPGDFYEVSRQAAKRLGRRALLLGAPPLRAPGVLALPYAPYSQIFSDAAAVVHQGGSGTLGEAFRAGRPMLVVPYGWDQPDNAARVERLGAGLALARSRYSVDSAAQALGRLLRDERFSQQAAEMRLRLEAENGLHEACNAIEGCLAG